MSGKATRNLARFIKGKGIKGTAICEATGITKDVLYPCMNGKRELRADEFLKICFYVGAKPEEMYKEEISNDANGI